MGETTQYGRPVYNEGGERYSERTRTVSPDGVRWFNVPTVMADGRTIPDDVSDDELAYMYDQWGWKDTVTGEPLAMFPDAETAVQSARKRSDGIVGIIEPSTTQ
mgnify:FL=1